MNSHRRHRHSYDHHTKADTENLLGHVIVLVILTTVLTIAWLVTSALNGPH